LLASAVFVGSAGLEISMASAAEFLPSARPSRPGLPASDVSILAARWERLTSRRQPRQVLLAEDFMASEGPELSGLAAQVSARAASDIAEAGNIHVIPFFGVLLRRQTQKNR
jgi:hypothetical protein